MAIHPRVRSLADTFLASADAEAPGLVVGLYLTGSVALRDFRPHASDVDFVAVTRHRTTPEENAALRRAHAAVRAAGHRLQFNGVHLTADDLVAPPSECAAAPAVVGGRFRTASRHELNPVTWHVLAERGITVRGPHPAELDVCDGAESLRTWSLGNLEEHWRRWRAKAGRLLTPRGLAALGSLAPSWSVLSVTRLHFTLRTSEITSKSGAGVYALHSFDERWHQIVNECLRVRRGGNGPSLFDNSLVRRRAALDYIEMVIDDALEARTV